MVTARLGLALLAILAAAPAAAAASGWTIASSEVREVHSNDGQTYRLIIRRPTGTPPAAGWPALWLLDGDPNFATAADLHARLLRFSAGKVADGYIIAIASPDMARRAFDYTPTPDDHGNNRLGGAAAFRELLTGKLMPELGAELALDPARRSMMGHSHGGLFVIDTMLQQPKLFRTYVASSPSLWAASRHVQQSVAALATRLDGASPSLVLTVGDRETGGPAGSRDGVAANTALAQQLARVEGISVRLRILPHETHGSAVLPALGQALPEVFAR